MKKLRLIIPIILLPIVLLAQPDFGGKAFEIPSGSGLSLPSAPLPSTNSASIFDVDKKPRTIAAPEPNINFGKPNTFANPNEQYLEKLNKKEGETNTAIRKNQYMGDVKTKAGSVRVVYRDHEYPDGDMIKVSVNDVIFLPRIVLDSQRQGFDLTLVPGFNKIDFEALNQGSSGPNTAQFEVYDDKDKLISSNQWNLATGFKATVIVIKE